MKISVNNSEPSIEAIAKDRTLNDISVKCIIDTWFTWFLSISFFKWNDTSLVHQFKFLNKPKLLPESKWVETASWPTETYLAFISIYIEWRRINSELLICKSNADYSVRRDTMLLWMDFLKENKNILNIDFTNNSFELL